jgi:hypothetical protein
VYPTAAQPLFLRGMRIKEVPNPAPATNSPISHRLEVPAAIAPAFLTTGERKPRAK